MKQHIQIRGESTENPVMIFIHGGPASPMGYVSAYYQRELESELTIINYDQRGCGRTYYASDCNANSNIDLLVNDLNVIVEYAKKRFGKDNVIIAGHSGSARISYFRKLDQLVIGDKASLNYKGKVYNYKIVDIYDIDKTGKAEIIREKNKSTLTLITCRHNTKKQIVVIAELIK